ncbi:uncharacterized protein LOC111088540 [Limulus polyphemus]|uniref:Uncharacterized protein LOC111088540 n=1 Tax=Limulus polyphemus TaxID=6850 RepID=A0ABM1TFQ0_LIMPO|nr:uncharacterized protein LOC111088540 [Limulus polyphemus]
MAGFWSNDLDYVLCRTPDPVDPFLNATGGVVLDLSSTDPPSECPSNHVITAIADLNNYYYIRLDEAKCLPLAEKWKIDYFRCVIKTVVAARAPLSNMTNWSNQCPVDDNVYFITQLIYYTGKNYLKEFKCCPAIKFMFN